MDAEPAGDQPVRTAELIASLCLATDLGMAFPFEHGLHTTLIAMRLADRLDVDRKVATETYYSALLAHAARVPHASHRWRQRPTAAILPSPEVYRAPTP